MVYDKMLLNSKPVTKPVMYAILHFEKVIIPFDKGAFS
jgi:hypothetical protein